MKKNPLTVTLMEHPEHMGDWHDKPLRYLVSGDGFEKQKFSTKKEALAWRSIRPKYPDFNSAFRASMVKDGLWK